jgi:uncharacterized membrane protein YcaP (DUF421 family)
MWFDSWGDIARVLLVGTAAYATLIIVLRLSGKRTLSQLNAFDFVVTVAIGSTLATILLSADVTWSQGFAALALLVGLQFVVAVVASRWPRARSVISAHPVVLVRDGTLQRDAIARHRLTETEVEQAVRSSGSGDLSAIAAVVLETNGTLSVISRDKYGDGSAMGSMRERDAADET